MPMPEDLTLVRHDELEGNPVSRNRIPSLHLLTKEWYTIVHITYRNPRILLNILALLLIASHSVQAQSHHLLRLSGSIDHRLMIEMTLERDGRDFIGFYFYDRVGRSISVSGSLDRAGDVRLDETGGGFFVGRLVDGQRLTGTWRKERGAKALPFILDVEPNPSTDRDVPGSVVLEEKTLRIRRPQFPTKSDMLLRYPVVRGTHDAAILRKLNAALTPDAIHPEEAGDKREDDAWLDEIGYDLNYNKHSLLDITFYVTGVGAYPDTLKEHVLLDIKTGKSIHAADVFKPNTLQALAAFIDKNLQEEVREARHKNSDDTFVTGLLGGRFTVEDLDHFSVGEKGLTFSVEYNFPHAVKAAEPPGLFFYPYATLKPYLREDGPLGTLSRTR